MGKIGGKSTQAGVALKADAAQGYLLESLEPRVLLAGLAAGAGGADQVYLPKQFDLFNPNGYLTAPSNSNPLDIARKFLAANSRQLGMSPADVNGAAVTDEYTDEPGGVTHIYLRQRYNGLEVSNANIVVNIDKDGRLLSVGGGFVKGLSPRPSSSAIGSPRLSAAGAVNTAAGKVGLQPKSVRLLKREQNLSRQTTFISDVSVDPVPAELHYLATANGVKLAWDVTMRTPDGEHWYDISVDAASGTTLAQADWVDQASYDVFPTPDRDPNDGPRQVVNDPNDPVASPYGWHDTNGTAGAEFTDTRGNNVFAQEDGNADNSGGFRPDGGAGLRFDFPLDLTQAPAAYQPAAITNLFYWTNLLHDVHARYGFTEAAGNFQLTDYSGQGVGGDPVYADAQDGSSSNNASFATPPDGSSPRMQMFNFTSTSPQRDADLDAQVIIHEYGHGISNRLTGGPSNVGALGATQSAGMGEGWSDWWSLMLLQKSTDAQNGGYGIGTYLLGQPASGTGIRREPYSYDMSIDALTASAFNSTQEVHNTGEIWCSALWDMNWLLINKYGFGANIAGGYNANVAGSNGGNELGLQLVMDALKLQPVNPSFLNARDAILTADQNLNGGADKLQIWQAFARRGLGFSSTTAGSTSSSITQAFDIPVSLQKPRVLSSTPSGTQSSAVSSVDLAFNKAMNPASFVVSDDVTSFTGPGGMNLLGQISGFSWLNSNQTLRISFAAQNTDGQYALTVGPNILAADDGSAMDQNQNDVAGEMPGDQYTARFGYDSLPLAVASTTPANASVVTLPMTTVDVKFNEPYDPATIGTADLTLSQGSVISATVVDTTTVRYGLSGIASEGTLTVSMAAGALGDLDGNPSNAYGGSFTTDVGTVAFPALAGKNPLGAGVFDGSASGTVGYAGDTDSFTFTVDAGQTITALADPGTTLRPTIELRNGGGTLVGSATAAAANRDAVIQNYAAAAGGAYTITISGNASTTGSYAVGLTLNAALEGEAHDGASNNTTGTAQDLASAFGAINASAARAAVVGTLSSTDTADLFAIALNGGDSLTAVTKAVSGSIADVYLLDSGGATLSYDTTGPSNVDRIISDFIAPAGGAYYLKVFGSTTSTYNLALTKNGEFDTESNDTTATAPWVLSKQSAGTQTAVGRIDTGNIDLYAVTLAAGAHLTAATSTPGDGAGEPLNAFNPRLRLLDSAGTMITSDDNSAADGRNAVLSYTAGTAGKYFVEVSSTTTSSTLGDYVLTIGGASTALPPFTGTITSPASGAKVKTAPTTVTVSFNDSVLLGSVSAGDLTVDGVAATAFSVQGSNSINFTLPTNIAEGTHNLAIAAGAISDIQGTALAAVAGSFTLDLTAPRVIASSIAEGDARGVGALTATIQFSEAMAAANLDATDFTLAGVYRATSYVAASLAFDAPATTLTLNWTGLPDDKYTLTLLAGSTRFEDLVGNALDGEPVWPMPPNRSGNGTAGGNFFVNFPMDATSSVFPVSLQPKTPLGSLVYDGTATTVISFAGDTDAFTINLDAGQALTVLADAGATLQPTISLQAPSGALLGTVTSPGVGKDVVLQSAAVAGAGVYTVTVGGAGNSVGAANVGLTLNAALENESHDGAANNSVAAAQNIDGSFLSLGGNSSRSAVVGTSDPSGGVLPNEVEANNTTATANNAAANFSAYTGSIYQIGLSGNITGGDADWFNIGAMQVGDVITVSLAGAGGARGTLNDAYVELYRAGSSTAVASSDDDGSLLDSLIYRFPVATADTYYIRAKGFGSTDTGTYQLGAFLENVSTAPSTGGTRTTETESNNTQAAANDLSSSWRGAQYLSRTGAQVTAGDVDVFQYTFFGGDLITVNADSTSSADVKVSLLNSAGTVIASEDGTSNGPGLDSLLYGYVIPASGTYYLQVQPYTGTGTYNADIYLSTNTTPPAPAATADYYAFTLGAGDSAALGVAGYSAGTLSVTLRDGSNNILASGTGTATNLNSWIASYTAATGGTYYAAVAGGGIGYTLLVSRNAAFDAEPNDALAGAQALGNSGVAFGSLAASGTTSNLYSDGFETGSLGPLWSTYASRTGGRVRITNAQGAASGAYAMLMDNGSNDGVDTLNEAQWTVNLAGQSSATLTFAAADFNDEETSFAGDFSGHYNADGVAISADGITWHPIWDAADQITGQWQTYSFDLVAKAAEAGMTLGNNFLIRFQQFDNFALTSDGRGYDDVAILVPAPGNDYFSFQAAAGAALSISTATPADGAGEYYNPLNPSVELYDAGGNLVASDDNSAADGRNALLNYTTAGGGSYKLRLVPVGGIGGDYVVRIASSGSPAPAAPDLLAVTDSGASGSDDLTNYNNAAGKALQFSVANAAANATVTIYADGVAIGSAPSGNGAGTIITTDAAGALLDGAHTITARQTIGGNESPDSLPLTVTIDTAAPAAPAMPDLSDATDSGTSTIDNITNITTPTFAVTGNPYFRLYRDAVKISGDYESGTFTTTTQADGVYSYAAGAVDAAGNESALGTGLSVTIDTVAPATPTAPALQAASDSGISNSDRITNIAAPAFDVNAAPYFRLYRDGGLVSGLYEVGTSYTMPAQADGAYNMTIAAVDAAGNASTASAATPVTIDTTAPAAPIAPKLQAASDSGISSSDRITNITTPAFDVAGGPYFRIFRGGTLVSQNFEGGTAYTSSALTDGAYTFTVAAVDAAGNASAASPAVSLTIDTIAPAAPTVAPDLQGASDSGASSTDNITNITSPVFTLASPGANYHRFYRGGTKIADYLTGTTYTAAGQTDGAWSYQESFVDAAGNESAAGPALAVAIDTVAPTLLSAASRKTHGSAGTFDLALNLGDATTATVEPRRNAAGDLLVFNFSESITGSAGTVSAMQFPATNAAFTAAATSAGVLTLTLNSATDASVVSVGLNGLFDVAGNALAGTTVVYLRVLDGDVNQTTSVSVSDLQGVKNHLLEDVTAGNFLFDVNVSGGISVSDLQEVKNHLLNGVA